MRVCVGVCGCVGGWVCPLSFPCVVLRAEPGTIVRVGPQCGQCVTGVLYLLVGEVRLVGHAR